MIATLVLLPIVSGAQEGGGNNNPEGGGNNSVPRLDNPIDGADSFSDLVYVVLNNVVIPIGSVVIVFFIIYSGFLFVTARGNPGQIENARGVLLYVIIGSAILLGSWVIASAIAGTICQIAGVLCDPSPNVINL